MRIETMNGVKEVKVVPDKSLAEISGSGVYKLHETDKFLYIKKSVVDEKTGSHQMPKDDAILEIVKEYRNYESRNYGKSVWDILLERRVGR